MKVHKCKSEKVKSKPIFDRLSKAKQQKPDICESESILPNGLEDMSSNTVYSIVESH